MSLKEILEELPKPERPSVVDTLGDLVGSLRAAPCDLSTDPKWMENFGEDIGCRRGG
jgi:hypothetical protein